MLKALQSVDLSDQVAVDAFKAKHYLDDEKLAELQTIRLPPNGKFRTIAQRITIFVTGSVGRKRRKKKINPLWTGMTSSSKWIC